MSQPKRPSAAATAKRLECSERQVKRWRADPSFPKFGGDEAAYFVAIADWLKSRDTKTATAKTGIERERAARIRKIEAETDIKLGRYVLKSEMRTALADFTFTLKRALRSAEIELATQLVGLTAAQAREKMSAAHRKILLALATEKWIRDERN